MEGDCGRARLSREACALLTLRLRALAGGFHGDTPRGARAELEVAARRALGYAVASLWLADTERDEETTTLEREGDESWSAAGPLVLSALVQNETIPPLRTLAELLIRDAVRGGLMPVLQKYHDGYVASYGDEKVPYVLPIFTARGSIADLSPNIPNIAEWVTHDHCIANAAAAFPALMRILDEDPAVLGGTRLVQQIEMRWADYLTVDSGAADAQMWSRAGICELDGTALKGLFTPLNAMEIHGNLPRPIPLVLFVSSILRPWIERRRSCIEGESGALGPVHVPLVQSAAAQALRIITQTSAVCGKDRIGQIGDFLDAVTAEAVRLITVVLKEDPSFSSGTLETVHRFYLRIIELPQSGLFYTSLAIIDLFVEHARNALVDLQIAFQGFFSTWCPAALQHQCVSFEVLEMCWKHREVISRAGILQNHLPAVIGVYAAHPYFLEEELARLIPYLASDYGGVEEFDPSPLVERCLDTPLVYAVIHDSRSGRSEAAAILSSHPVESERITRYVTARVMEDVKPLWTSDECVSVVFAFAAKCELPALTASAVIDTTVEVVKRLVVQCSGNAAAQRKLARTLEFRHDLLFPDKSFGPPVRALIADSLEAIMRGTSNAFEAIRQQAVSRFIGIRPDGLSEQHRLLAVLAHAAGKYAARPHEIYEALQSFTFTLLSETKGRGGGARSDRRAAARERLGLEALSRTLSCCCMALARMGSRSADVAPHARLLLAKVATCPDAIAAQTAADMLEVLAAPEVARAVLEDMPIIRTDAEAEWDVSTPIEYYVAEFDLEDNAAVPAVLSLP